MSETHVVGWGPMVKFARPSLVNELVSRLGISWATFCIVLPCLQILTFVVTHLADEGQPVLNWHHLRDACFAPALTLLILLTSSRMNRRLEASFTQMQSYLSLTAREFQEVLAGRELVRRKSEIAALTAGWVLGVVVGRPWVDLGTWQAIFVGVISEGIAFALLGWVAYVFIAQSQILTDLHRRPITKEDSSDDQKDPFVRWNLQLGLFLAVLALGGLLLVPDRTYRENLLILGGGLTITLLMLLVNRTLSGLVVSLSRSRILYAFLLMAFTALAGALGYKVIEGWDLMDGLFMTLITMTTIGYGETHPLTEAGRIFTMGLIVVSVGIAGYAISTVAAYVVEGEFSHFFRNRRMEKEISKLKEHVILCGAGRVGREVADELYKTLTPFVIIEPSLEALQHIPFLDEIPYVQADASRDEVLRSVGIERAKGLIASLHDDPSNLFLVLSARALNTRLKIVSRLGHDENRNKILRAGADAVVHAEAIGGLRMASLMVRPSVVGFLDKMLRVTGEALRVEEVEASPSMVEKTLAELSLPERTGLLVMARKSAVSRDFEFNPPPTTRLEQGDVLVVMGTPSQVAKARLL